MKRAGCSRWTILKRCVDVHSLEVRDAALPVFGCALAEAFGDVLRDGSGDTFGEISGDALADVVGDAFGVEPSSLGCGVGRPIALAITVSLVGDIGSSLGMSTTSISGVSTRELRSPRIVRVDPIASASSLSYGGDGG